MKVLFGILAGASLYLSYVTTWNEFHSILFLLFMASVYGVAILCALGAILHEDPKVTKAKRELELHMLQKQALEKYLSEQN